MKQSFLRSIWTWIVGTLLLVTLYLLSMGPAYWMANHEKLPFAVCRTLYAPVWECTRRSDWLDDITCRYLQVWNVNARSRRQQRAHPEVDFEL